MDIFIYLKFSYNPDLREWLSVYETLIGEEYRPISWQTIFNDASGLLGREYLQHLKTRNLEEAVACRYLVYYNSPMLHSNRGLR